VTRDSSHAPRSDTWPLGAPKQLTPAGPFVVVVVHLGLVALGYFLAFLLNADFDMAKGHWHLFFVTIPVVLAIRAATFGWLHLYDGLWRYVSMRDILAILRAVTLGSLVLSAGVLAVFGREFPRTVLLLDWLLCLALVGGVRLGFRALWESGRDGQERGRRAIVVGAVDAGELLVREIERNPGLDYDVVGYVDDDRDKEGSASTGRESWGASSNCHTGTSSSMT